MDSIDAIRINFNEEQLGILNICLAFLMFGVALDIRLADFRRIFRNPKAPLVGLTAQLLLLPLLTLALAYFFNPPASMALGMVLIAACPGGNVSNFAVHLAGANAALSVMLTSITTLAAIVITPLAFHFWSSLLPDTEALRQSISVNGVEMVYTIVQLVFVPLLIGMVLNHHYPAFTERIKAPVRWLSIMIFFSFVVFAILGNYENIVQHLGKVFWIVLIHNTAALLLGFTFARTLKLSKPDIRTISIETGIQNSGLGLILIFNFFDGLGGMAMIAAWWGIWHLISGFSVAMWFRYRAESQKASVPASDHQRIG